MEWLRHNELSLCNPLSCGKVFPSLKLNFLQNYQSNIDAFN